MLQERVNEAEDVPHEPVGRSDFAEILAAPSLTFQDTCRGEIAADLADLEAELAAESVDDGSFGMAVEAFPIVDMKFGNGVGLFFQRSVASDTITCSNTCTVEEIQIDKKFKGRVP